MSRGESVGAPRRRTPWSPTSLSPVQLDDGLLELRTPRLADGPAWSAARLANREWLERAFPAWGGDWAAEQSEVAWAQRWARLRRLALSGRSLSFVMTLDGELIGEIGVDAVDQMSGAGEASVWMVRSHGSSTVMAAGSLLLIEHAFGGPHRLGRLLSPVATSSRRGRAPGLRAVGFEIEATVPRRVGATGLVDHDIWVLHNTAENRRTTTGALHALRVAAPSAGDRHPPRDGSQEPTAPGSRGALALTAGRAALRETRGGLRRARSAVTARRSGTVRRLSAPGSDTSVTLRRATGGDLREVGGVQTMPPHATRWAAEVDAQVVAVIAHADDSGTATTEVFVRPRTGADRDLVSVAIGTVLDDLRPAADEPRVLVVRVPIEAVAGGTVDDDLLAVLGLERIATYRAHPDGTHRWGGEDVWRAPAVT